jgi:hypothetical protein
MQVDDAGAVFDEPVEAAAKTHGFADDEGADVELANEAAAVPAGSERGDHDFVAVGALAAGFAKGVGLAVNARVALLDAAVAAAAEQSVVGGEEGGTDWDAAFVEAEAGFVGRDAEHGEGLLEVRCAHGLDLRERS